MKALNLQMQIIMSKSAFDPRLLEKYSEPKSLLHFQWGDDTKVYRYALVEIINEDEIDPTLNVKKRRTRFNSTRNF